MAAADTDNDTRFYLVQEFKAHNNDVRALALIKLGDDQFLCATASRDGTTKLWELNEPHFRPQWLFRAIGHAGYVVSALFFPRSELHDLILVTGGNDAIINLYEFEYDATTNHKQLIPSHALIGHRGAVTALARIHERLLSVSFDGDLKVWDILTRVCVNTVRLSERPLWDVMPLNCKQRVAIAGADTHVHIVDVETWAVEQILQGHTDCVRSLAIVSADNFVSAGNDGLIIEWVERTGILHNRINPAISLIFSVNHFSPKNVTVGCGENGAVTVLTNREITQIIPHPAQTVWTSLITENGTLITGSSDGFIRAFSMDKKLCSEELERNFDQASAIFATRFRIGEQNIRGREALSRPGRCVGDSLVVKDTNASFLHRWNGSQWTMIGEVMGGANTDNTQGLSKAFDYEFDVDIEDGQPPYKLYFNKNQNPTEVAESFILVHKLPAAYKSQIVDFILKNTEPAVTDVSGAADPFTGGSRYIPGGSAAVSTTSLFPLTDFIIMSNVDLKKLEAKIVSFDCVKNVPKESLSEMVRLGVEGHKPSNAGVALLFEAMESWPEDCLYPVFDIVRLALRNEMTNTLLCEGEKGAALLCFIKKCLLSQTNSINATFCVRIVGNMVAHKSGADVVLKEGEDVLAMVVERLRVSHDAKLEVALATLVANLSALYYKSNKKELCTRLKPVVEETLVLFQGSEGRARALAALGTIYSGVQATSIPETVRCVLVEWASAAGDAGSPNNVTAFASALLNQFSKS